MRKSRNSGFTLIEVLVVVIILAALAGVIVPMVSGVPTGQKVRIAKMDMKGIGTALDMYRLDHNGKYPKELGELRKPRKPGADPYIDKDLKDPWDNEYQYKYPGSRNPMKYDLYSKGPDGVDHGGDKDDVADWHSGR
jgi:general secretion pathway protein G